MTADKIRELKPDAVVIATGSEIKANMPGIDMNNVMTVTDVLKGISVPGSNVLIIGGGMNGLIEQILKYEEIGRIDYLEIDPQLAETTRKYLPEHLEQALEDPRVNIQLVDGRKNLKDCSHKPHTKHRKITLRVEEAIILLRDIFQWETQRIKIALLSPPLYIKYLLENVLDIIWTPIKLNRQGINNIQCKIKINGSPYQKDKKDWKFFRAEFPNDMW